MPSVSIKRSSAQSTTPLGGSLVYLLMNLPFGIAGFVTLFTLITVGVSTSIVWVGLPVAALAILLARGAAKAERARVLALLDAVIPPPYLPLPDSSQRLRWRVRLRDGSTWRDLAYFFVLFPLGIVEFTVVVTLWSTSLALAGLPLYYRFLPGGAYYFPAFDERWITVDSPVKALPWVVLGVLLLALSVKLTKVLASTHAELATAMLGPTSARRHRLENYVDEAKKTSVVTAG